MSVYVALGSNLGDRAAMLEAAEREIEKLPGVRILRRSKVHHTAALLPPGDPTPQPEYLNAVLELVSELSAPELLAALKDIERRLGRDSAGKWAPRLIDLDLLLYGDVVLDEPGLVLPHPGMASRTFVLEPLAELAPQLRHPVLGQSIAALLAAAAV